jgi:hypothetical protein
MKRILLISVIGIVSCPILLAQNSDEDFMTLLHYHGKAREMMQKWYS